MTSLQFGAGRAADYNVPDVVATAERTDGATPGLSAEGGIAVRTSERRDGLASLGSRVGGDEANGGSEGEDSGETHGECCCAVK